MGSEKSERIARRDLFRRVAASGAALGVLGAVLDMETVGAATPDVPMADKVPTKELGTTGAQVPILLMGGAQAFDPVFDKLLHRALKEGVFYIDAGEEYANGQSHKGVGTFIEQVGRENVWITSKTGLFGHELAPPEVYRSHMEKEMPVLKTDYLDMYFMHGVEDPRLLGPEYIKMGQDMKKSGLAKFFGFSCHDGTVVELLNKSAEIGTAGIDAVMFKYSFAMYGDLELNRAIDACVKAGIGLIAMKAQDSVPEDKEEVLKFRSQDFTLPQAKLKAVWADERIDACVSGIGNMKILRENTAAAKSTVQLSMKDFMQLNQYAARTAHHRCKLCNQICESRIDGDLRVSAALRYLMYDECYGDHEEARRLYRALSPSERDFEGIDLAAAMDACPRNIDIAERLAEAQRRLI